MLPSHQERQVESEDGAAATAAAEVVDAHAACDHGTQFSDEGELPAVDESTPRPPQPSASDRAYGTPAARAARSGASGARAGAASGITTTQTEHMLHGVRIITPAGVSIAAIAEVGQIIGQLLGKNEVAQRQLAAVRATMVIIPARSKMTDLPQFAGLRGRKTFDGRDWETVRGSGGMRASDGSFAIGVAEENLARIPGVISSYPAGYSIGMHELAHTVESHGMTARQKEQLKALYAQQKKDDATDFTDGYAAKNEHEYFAQATNAFFGKNVGNDSTGKKNANGREWLRTHDPDMFAFLVQMYETTYKADEPRS